VGKEQIIGLLCALTRFAKDNDAARNQRFTVITDSLVRALNALPGAAVRTIADAGHGGMPMVEISIESGRNKPTALQIAARLRAGSPSVHVESTNADAGVLLLVPTCLGADDAAAIGRAFAAAMTR
jgi:seryl-tRNA(Sec) selenium transferase